MHYFIDGYNLLFRLVHEKENLKHEREKIILDLNKKVSLLNLDVSLVFDSTFQVGERTRHHYHQIEILFTAEGETADEYIIGEIKDAIHPEKQTVVTSDKQLAYQIKSYSAHIESVESFISRLNKAYQNKIQRLNKEKLPPQIPLPAPIPRSLIPQKEAPLASYFDYYSEIFESKWKEIEKEAAAQKQVKKSPNDLKKRKKKQPKRQKNPFDNPLPPEEKAATEMERWLKIFEKRLSS